MPPLVLGVHSGHNAGAAVLSGGRVLAAVSEERLVRFKNVTGYPRRAIDLCLSLAGASASDLDAVALGGRQTFGLETDAYVRWMRDEGPLPFPRRPGRRRLAPLGAAGRALWPVAVAWANRGRDEADRVPPWVGPWEYVDYPPGSRRVDLVVEHLGIDRARVAVVDHHQCHAFYSAFAAPWRDEPYAVLTADQVGDWANATVWKVEPGRAPEEVARSYSLNSLGRIYSAVTGFLGMKPLEDEHKVMGLAPYARFEHAARLHAAFADLLRVDGLHFSELRPAQPCWRILPRRLGGERFDVVAGALQLFLEKRLAEWFRSSIRSLGTPRIAFGGGVALNVKANRVLGDLPDLGALHVAPGPGDESLGIGAAYAVSIERGLDPAAVVPLGFPALGDEARSDEVGRALEAVAGDGRFAVRTGVDAAELAARAIAAGKVVARFSGRMEFGPRALGNRSILADASDAGLVGRLNARVKNRDFWMPFAPAILAERAGEYVVNPRGLDASAMTIALRSTGAARRDLAAAMHPADGTLRAQVVSRETNPGFHDLLSRCAARTGRGGVLNTSFNLHGEPIVHSPEDAVRTFVHCDLDLLAFDDAVVERREVDRDQCV